MASDTINTFVGDTGTPFIFTLTLVDGSAAPLSGMTGANFTLDLWDAAQSLLKQCTGGVWTVVDANKGVVQYQPVTADVNAQGSFQAYLTVQFANGPKTWPPGTIIIQPKH